VDVETIQVVLDKKLLQATDKAARRLKRNRSALVRDALREHLRRIETLAREEQDRQGYMKHPQTANEWGHWEAEAVWPEK
jgi:metal-responsive CopG/Arc/MetJ family transcriptional regulator